jgi:hypothetical protein
MRVTLDKSRNHLKRRFKFADYAVGQGPVRLLSSACLRLINYLLIDPGGVKLTRRLRLAQQLSHSHLGRREASIDSDLDPIRF